MLVALDDRRKGETRLTVEELAKHATELASQRAFLYDDPASFRGGMVETLRAILRLAAEPAEPATERAG